MLWTSTSLFGDRSPSACRAAGGTGPRHQAASFRSRFLCGIRWKLCLYYDKVISERIRIGTTLATHTAPDTPPRLQGGPGRPFFCLEREPVLAVDSSVHPTTTRA
eukprot:1846661-Prymnesium_polylepis.1